MPIGLQLQAQGFQVNPKLKSKIEEQDRLEQELLAQQEKQNLAIQEYSPIDAFKDGFSSTSIPLAMYNYVSETYPGIDDTKKIHINSQKAIEWGKKYGIYDPKTWGTDLTSFTGSPITTERDLVARLESRKRANEASQRISENANGFLDHAGMFLGGATGVILDPTILLPSGAITKSVQGAKLTNTFYKTRNAISVGTTSAVVGGVQSYTLQKLQARNDDTELALAMGVGGVLGMGAGAYIGSRVIKQAKNNEAIDTLLHGVPEDEQALIKQDMLNNLRTTGKLVTADNIAEDPTMFKLSNGMEVPNPRQADVLSQFNSHKFDKMSRYQTIFSMAPIKRALNSTSQEIANIAYKLFPSTITAKGSVDVTTIANYTNKAIKNYEDEITLLTKQKEELNKVNTEFKAQLDKTIKAYNTNVIKLRSLEDSGKDTVNVTNDTLRKLEDKLKVFTDNTIAKYSKEESKLKLKLEKLKAKNGDINEIKDTESLLSTITSRLENEVATGTADLTRAIEANKAVGAMDTKAKQKILDKLASIKDFWKEHGVSVTQDGDNIVLKEFVKPTLAKEAEINSAIEDYTKKIGAIKADYLEQNYRTSGKYLIQGETVADRKSNIEGMMNQSLRKLQKLFAEALSKGTDEGLTFNQFGEKIANDYNAYINKVKYEAYKLFKTISKDLEAKQKIYSEETGINIALSHSIPDDLDSVVLEALAKKIQAESNVSDMLTAESKVIQEYYTLLGKLGKEAGVVGMQNINPSFYMNRMWDSVAIRDVSEGEFLQDILPAITKSVEYKIAKEDMIDKLVGKGMGINEATIEADNLLSKQAQQMAIGLRSKVLQADLLKDVETAYIVPLGSLKLRTVPLDETLATKYLVNNAIDRMHYYNYKYSGRIAMAEKLGVSTTSELRNLLLNSVKTKANVSEMEDLEAMVEDLLGLRGLNMFHAKGASQFFNELKKFNFATMMEDAWFNATILESANVYRIVGKELFNLNSLKTASNAMIDAYRARFPNAIPGKLSNEESQYIETLLLSNNFMAMDMRAFNQFLEGASQTGNKGFAHKTSMITEFLSHAYGMKPMTYLMQVHSRSTYLVSLLRQAKNIDKISDNELNKLAKYGLDKNDVKEFASIMKYDDSFKGVRENFNFDNFKTDKQRALLDRILNSARKAGEDMVLHYDASTLPRFITKYDNTLVGLMAQFLKFPMVANEKLMLASLDTMDSKTIGALMLSLGVAYLNTAWFEEFKIGIGLKEEKARYYTNEDGSLNMDKFVPGALGYVGFAGVAPTLGEKVWRAIQDINNGKLDKAILDTALGVTHSSMNSEDRLLRSVTGVTLDYLKGEDIADKDVENIEKYGAKLLPFEGHLMTDLARLTAKALDEEDDKDLVDIAEEDTYQDMPTNLDYIERNNGTTNYEEVLNKIGVKE